MSLLTSLPLELVPWVVDETTDARTAARRIQAEFLEAELHLRPPFSVWLARAIARIAAALMRDINAVPVHQHSRKMRTTVERSVELLEQGKNILVFPEDPDRKLNDVLCHFCTGFVHLARRYYERTRRAVLFLPVAVNRKVRTIAGGTTRAVRRAGALHRGEGPAQAGARAPRGGAVPQPRGAGKGSPRAGPDGRDRNGAGPGTGADSSRVPAAGTSTGTWTRPACAR